MYNLNWHATFVGIATQEFIWGIHQYLSNNECLGEFGRCEQDSRVEQEAGKGKGTSQEPSR